MDIQAKKVEKILSEIKMIVKKKVVDLFPLQIKECGYKENNILPIVDNTWDSFDKGQRFGGYDKHFWIYKQFTTPNCLEEHELRFSLDTGAAPNSYGQSTKNPQCILYVNGELVQGLDLNHLEYELKPNTDYEIYIYLYTGLYHALYDMSVGVVNVNQIYEELYYDLMVPFEAAKLFDEDDFMHMETIKHLNIAVMKLDMRNGASKELEATAKEAMRYLEENYYGQYPAFDIQVDCIGHTHIDVAWMWTYAQTKEKVQRSFSIVLRLMEKYPEYKFMISQPQLLLYLKEEAPEIYEQVKERVKEGRIEIEGAMWVEPDCNLSSGESLVRQLIKGKEFIRKEFGVESKILWLPDVFGYSAALPQILKKAGVDKFVTSKIGWNEYNSMPYDIFNWKGIDGTEILTYFMTGHRHTWKNRYTSYVGEIDPDFILGTWERLQQKDYSNETFLAYGYGDGGGGPTAEMLEQRRRIDAGILGLPKAPAKTVTESLDSIEQKFYENAKKLHRLPKWVGELYLEFHRGTYTSVGKVKWFNRKCEFLCGNTEKMSVINMLLNNMEYPKEQLESAWHTVLLNQFHDVVPGSSIHEVYEDVFRMYEGAIQSLNTVNVENARLLTEAIKADGKIIVVNPNAFEISDVIELDEEKNCLSTGIVPALGWKVIEAQKESCQVEVIEGVERKLINQFYEVTFDEHMDIVSIYDKQNKREVIKSGAKANEFRMYEDLPYAYDAWELSEYHQDKYWTVQDVVKVTPLLEGARAGFEVVKRFNKSVITQKIYLYNELRRIDFKTHLDWQQRHMIFKAAFPVDVNAGKAVYDIQFGNMERTHNINTSWDVARFESCAHKWVDISDGGYGMALMNDCKYGYSVVEDSTLQLSLIRGGNSPIEEIDDQGEHVFSYSILPHDGDFRVGGVVKEAYIFNNPLWKLEGKDGSGVLPTTYSFVSADKDNIIIETIKKAEESDHIILRLYEAYNKKSTVNLNFGGNVQRAYICNLLEQEETEVAVKGNIVTVEVSNYEVITLKVEF